MTDIPDGTPVDIYWNLHKKCFSVKSRARGSYGRVIAHAQNIGLTAVTLIVSDKGRQRVLREQRKNVHAYLRGVWTATPSTGTVPVAYNPYAHTTFMSADQPIHQAKTLTGTIHNGHPKVLVGQ